jgi:hypothetical protein
LALARSSTNPSRPRPDTFGRSVTGWFTSTTVAQISRDLDAPR